MNKQIRRITLYSLGGVIAGILFGIVILVVLGLPLSTFTHGIRPARNSSQASVTTPDRKIFQDGKDATRLLSVEVPETNARKANVRTSDDALLTALREENTQLRELNKDLQTQLADIFNWMLATYKGKYPLPESQITNLSLAALSDTFELSNEIIDFMNIDTNDAELINDLFAYGASVLNQIIDEQISVTESENGKVVLHIPAFADEGSILREDIYAALETTLGPYRFDRFMDVTSDKMDTSFYYFGDATHTIIFEPIYISDDEPLQWTIRDGWIITEEDNSRTIKATETTVTELPEDYQRYSGYLPSYLQP